MKSVQKIIVIFLVVLIAGCKDRSKNKPKLVVGIVIDQMRYDYLEKFSNKFSRDGFKRLMREGFTLANAHYNYIPTATAPGHASIFTGSTPSHHGIIGNYFYDKTLKKMIYCMTDDRFKTIGGKNGGNKSMARLQTTTVSDQLKLAQGGKGKTIGISLKDRSAMLPAGHSANSAYWFEGASEGKFITSSFYTEKLPEWVKVFNKSDTAEKLLNQTWNTYYPIKKYTESLADEAPYERPFKGKKTATFPYDLQKLKKENGGYNLLKTTPFGNDLLLAFAKATIKGEKLGQGHYKDFLSVSFSSTDYVGHQFGIHSKEVEDTYIRLDQNIDSLLSFLDKEVGKGNYILFLTADHAAAPNTKFLKSLRIPADFFSPKSFENFVTKLLLKKYGTQNIVENISNNQIFLNETALEKNHLQKETVVNYLVKNIMKHPLVSKIIGAEKLQKGHFERGLFALMKKGYHQKFSGDVLFALKTGVLHESYQKGGTSHGTGYNYDTHIPVIFYGSNIQKGTSVKYHPITDIAPTIAHILGITFGNFNSGAIVEEALE